MGALPSFGQSAVLSITTSGFQNENGVVTNGMTWGVVVDTNASGGSNFSDLQTSLTSSSVPTAGSNAQLNIGGVASDLYLFIDANNPLTTNSGPPSFADGYMFEIAIDVSGVASSGDSYFLMWLPDSNLGAGDPIGLLDPGLTLPSAGNTVDVSSSIIAGSADFTVIPEPTSTLLLMVGSFFLFLTRRCRR